MPNCTVHPTHHLGRQLPEKDWPAIPGPVRMFTAYREQQRRWVTCFEVDRHATGGKNAESPLPRLMDVELSSFSSERAFSVRGVEEINGARYYQTWYVTWD